MKMKRLIIVWLLLTIGLIGLAGCHRLMIPANSPSSIIALKSHHGRYITASGESDDWSLSQELELTECGWLTQYELRNGKVALKTCQDRFITAQRRGGAERVNWELWQDSGLGDCGQFDRVDLEDDKVAFKTCAGRYFTAGDGGWPPDLEWAVVAETDEVRDWEKFIEQPKP